MQFAAESLNSRTNTKYLFSYLFDTIILNKASINKLQEKLLLNSLCAFPAILTLSQYLLDASVAKLKFLEGSSLQNGYGLLTPPPKNKLNYFQITP